MKKYIVILLIISLFNISLLGCTPEEPDALPEDNRITEDIKLFYGDENNEKMVVEEREITYDEADDKYKVALEQLIEGPTDNNLTANISKETKVYGTIKQNGSIIVNLSSEFQNFGGSVAEIIGVGSIVNTLTQFENIERVKILVEGEELIGPNGEPRGFIKEFPLEPKEEASREVILYFGNDNAIAVVGETRVIKVPEGLGREDFIKMVVEELIKGPKREDLNPTIPAEVKVLSVEINDNMVHVDFSEEMHTKHWHGAAGEAITISSIANTLTEFDYIDKVKMTVEGKPLNIEHSILEEPVGRNENMIAK